LTNVRPRMPVTAPAVGPPCPPTLRNSADRSGRDDGAVRSPGRRSPAVGLCGHAERVRRWGGSLCTPGPRPAPVGFTVPRPNSPSGDAPVKPRNSGRTPATRSVWLLVTNKRKENRGGVIPGPASRALLEAETTSRWSCRGRERQEAVALAVYYRPTVRSGHPMPVTVRYSEAPADRGKRAGGGPSTRRDPLTQLRPRPSMSRGVEAGGVPGFSCSRTPSRRPSLHGIRVRGPRVTRCGRRVHPGAAEIATTLPGPGGARAWQRLQDAHQPRAQVVALAARGLSQRPNRRVQMVDQPATAKDPHQPGR